MRRIGVGVTAGLVAGVLCLVHPAWAQLLGSTSAPLQELNFYGGGAKAAALGGAFIGVADDASAGYWNPAGLTQNDRVYTGMDFSFASQRITNDLSSPADLNLLYTNRSSQTRSNFRFLSFNSPITVKGQPFYLSASWMRAGDDKYAADDLITDFSDFPADPTGTEEIVGVQLHSSREGGPQIATLAAATQLKEEVFSAGFGLNIYLGEAYDSSQLLADIDQTNPFTNVTVPLRSVQDSVNTRNFQGVNFNFGLLYQAEMFSVGAVVRSPFTVESENDIRLAGRAYQRTADSLLLITQNSVLYKTTTKIDMPLQLGVGLSYRPQENLILAADYEFRGFGSSKVFTQDSVLDPKSEFLEFDPQWADVHQIRLGIEYQLDVGWGVVPVRAGFRTEPLPYRHLEEVEETIFNIDDVPTEFEYGDQIVGEVFSLGSGVHWNQIRVDLTWEYRSTTAYQDGTLVDSFVRPPFIYEQANRRHKLLLGFTGYF